MHSIINSQDLPHHPCVPHSLVYSQQTRDEPRLNLLRDVLSLGMQWDVLSLGMLRDVRV